MPYPSDHKPRVHRRIVESAARLFLQRGFAAVSIDALMAESGLTRGGFYSHFKNKGELLREALAAAFDQSRENLFGRGTEALSGEAWQRRAAERYLTPKHRDAPEGGCPIPALSMEVARAPTVARRAFEAEVAQIIAEAEVRLGGPDARRRAISFLASSVGALLLSRAVKSEKLSREILEAVRSTYGGRPLR
ncbi:MAG: TetR/AcrR family transcriptional regulator [Polyangiaceae bacterium]